jgi:hypothetical protein
MMQGQKNIKLCTVGVSVCFVKRGQAHFKYWHLQYEFLFLSFLFLVIFFLSVLPSVLLFISASVFPFYSHYFSHHFCSFFFPFSCSFFQLFFPLLNVFSIFTPLFLSLLSLSYLQFYPHILPFPVPSLYYLFTFLRISASYSSQLLHVILERLRKSSGLKKPTGMYEYTSRCLIQVQYTSVSSPCPLNSVGLQIERFIIADLIKNLHQYNFAVASFTLATFKCSFCHTVQFTIGFGHEAWFMTPEELAIQSIRKIYCSCVSALLGRFLTSL